MKLRHLPLLAILTLTTLFSAEMPREPYEGLEIKQITVQFENQAPGEVDESRNVLQKLNIKKGNPFDQNAFDQDLKVLSEEYDWVDPNIQVEDKQVIVKLVLRQRPVVTRFTISNSSYRTKKLLKEAELTNGMRFNRENFYVAINKIKDFYVKKGYFKAEVNYKIENIAGSHNEVQVQIMVNEGPRGRIGEIKFEGFSKPEEKEILALIRTKKFNILTSWLTGDGTIKEDQLDPDVQVVVHHLQNQGFVDAHVVMRIEPQSNEKMALVINLVRGEKYFIHGISFSGNEVYDLALLKETVHLQPGDVFSIDKVRAAQESLRELYTKEGYLQTNVDYAMSPLSMRHEYDLHFSIEESEQSRVGLVLISGNYSTNSHVIYNNIDIEPGSKFDTTRLKSTQDRLMASGYFSSVNVYPVKPEEPSEEHTEYRDVMVEVKEAQTGNASLFAGFDSNQQVYGGIDLTENNFSIGGFADCWTKGISSFRGAGEFFQVKGSIGLKEQTVAVNWMNPYIFDTLWRFGMDFNYAKSNIISEEYTLHTLGGGMNASYPLSTYLTYGFTFRIKDALISVSANASPPLKKERENTGLISGLGTNINLDSTDNPFKPHKGIRSRVEGEFAGITRNDLEYNDFPFLKYASLNSLYIPVWAKGTLKFRGDARFIQPLWLGSAAQIPEAERFFLGGEGSVRGYNPGSIGPNFGDGDEPSGGISSLLLSAEYAQNIIKPLDAFVFFDAGSISLGEFAIAEPNMSYGAGIRLDIGRRLPFVLGYGIPINPANEDQVQGVFFSMAGQF